MIQIETTSHDPFFNQAFEDYVFRTFREDEVLLLWRNRPAVVVGCYQNICREVHVRALLEQGDSRSCAACPAAGRSIMTLATSTTRSSSGQSGAAGLRPLSGPGACGR